MPLRSDPQWSSETRAQLALTISNEHVASRLEPLERESGMNSCQALVFDIPVFSSRIPTGRSPSSEKSPYCFLTIWLSLVPIIKVPFSIQVCRFALNLKPLWGGLVVCFSLLPSSQRRNSSCNPATKVVSISTSPQKAKTCCEHWWKTPKQCETPWAE